MLHAPSSSSYAIRRTGFLRYGAAVIAVAAALLVSELLRPIVAPNPFLFVIGAIALSAGYGGLGPGLLATALAVLGVNYLFLAPLYVLKFTPPDVVRLGTFAMVATLVSSLSETRRRAERAAQAQHEQLRVTLSSIGDGVIATDTAGRVTFLNGVAEALTGWTAAEARGQPIDAVLRVVDAATRQPVELPLAPVLREGRPVRLADRALLLSRGGAEWPIDDSAAPIRDNDGRPLGMVLVFRDTTERERARERLALLADASTQLAASLDYDETLRQIARLCVPRLADWCVVEVPAANGQLHLEMVAHTDPAKEQWARELRERFPTSMDMPLGSPLVIRSGEPLLYPDVSDGMLEQAARDPEELRLLRLIGHRSMIVVPLRASDRIIGALALISTGESGRRYTPDDLALAEDLARRAGAALDNARLYRAAQAELALRQQAEEALRANENQLRLVADGLPVLISYVDREQRYRFNNRAYQDWFGEDRANLVGRHIRDVVGESAYERLRPWVEAALGGEAVSFEALSPYRSGGARYVHATYVPDRDEGGAVRGAVILVEDITARKRAEDGQRLLVAAGVLLASPLDYEATLRQVARLTVPDLADFTVIYLRGPDGRITRTAAAHVDPAQEALLTLLEREYPVNPDSDTPVARVLRSGRPTLGEGVSDELLGRIARDDRHLGLLRALGPRAFMIAPMQARGRTLGAMLLAITSSGREYTGADLSVAEELAYRAALAIDNAALYRSAEQARDAAERAAQRVAQLQQVTAALGTTMTIDEVADLVVADGLAAVEADAGAIFLLVEDGRTWEAASFRGYPPELAPRHARAPADAPGPLSAAREARQIVLVETPEELVRRWPHLADAQARSGDAATAAVPLLLGEEVLGVLYAAFRAPRRFSADDTAVLEAIGRQCAQALDRVRLYAAERAARAAAEEAVALRDRFLSVASHELKTPLTSLLLQTQLLQRRLGRAALLPERERGMLGVVSDQAQRLDRMIAALLDISRLERGQLSLSRSPIDLCALARRVVAELQPTTEAHALACTTPHDTLMVDGDELRLEQILQNLIQNAIKYSPDGGPVAIAVEAREGQACVVVSDRGIGIPAEALPRLFERFYRAPNADPRRISGLGIGLYVVQEIVRLHGGSVRAERQEGGGSRFTVCLPQASGGVLGPAGADATGADA